MKVFIYSKSLAAMLGVLATLLGALSFHPRSAEANMSLAPSQDPPWTFENWGSQSNRDDDFIGGPLAQSLNGNPVGFSALTEGPDGTLYALTGQTYTEHRIVSIRNGMVRPLAGTGMEGFRDGLAEHAMFSFNKTHYNNRFDLACDSQGTIYFSDFGNARIRRLLKKSDGLWYMETVVGGGGRTLTVGESAPALDVKMTAWLGPHVALALDDLIWLVSPSELYRYQPSTGLVTRFANPAGGILTDADGDRNGGAFFVMEFGGRSCLYYRINGDGTITQIAGTTNQAGSVYAGAPFISYFWTVTTMVSPPGPYIYVNAGDSWQPRRISKDSSENVKTLFSDGSWRESSARVDAMLAELVGWDGRGALYSGTNGRLVPPGGAPFIGVQPSSQTVTAGQTATFSVTASGAAPLSYQWQKNAANIAGATSASYTTPATAAADNGSTFRVVVTNTSGTVTSNAATLTVTASTAPAISTQPSSQTVTAGQTATFSVTSSGTAPLSYQWQKNGTAIAGATAASYTTPATTAADNGATYRVVVTNSAGSVTSSSATLTVTAASTAPAISTQPSSQTVTAGQTATFTVAASGTAPLSYQWQKNGANIAGATGASYTTPATTTADSGATYRVVVTNTAGSATSSSATLTVTAPPPPPADSDGDGLPDAWEQQHFGGLTQGAGGDPDGDGATNLREYQGGTDPMDSNSRPAGVGLPLPWVHADVGAVGVAGTASYGGTTFTGSGSGDIWDAADRFHFIYQPYSGDVQITARVASLLSSNVWAKAGVMVRESLAPGSMHTVMAVTSGMGVVYQGRPTTNGVSVTTAGPAVAAPYWVRIVRTGNLLTGYASLDGTGWTAVGTRTIAMGANVYVGLAVSSDDNVTLNTSTFDNVSVTTGGGSAGDADADGLPDAWEMTNFGNLAQTASGDPDADGYTNLAEYTAGTDPMNAASTPAGSGAAVGSGRDNANGDTCFASVSANTGGSPWAWVLAAFLGVWTLGGRRRM